ncbi:MAG TPA: DUF837 domain-containing protein [Methylorubrum populi]|uniref:DUF837 domain-containing protein n=1 Tax=Methylorubrum populi TaxID=223967 RepID=A0A921E4L1_9HYPH|nr:DUF837 domain-containing protein [Methylorubrum populi]
MLNHDLRRPVIERVKAYRTHLFERWVEAKRHAAQSDDIADHQAVADAYTRFMRAHLVTNEQAHLELEDEIARLTVENRGLRERLGEIGHA